MFFWFSVPFLPTASCQMGYWQDFSSLGRRASFCIMFQVAPALSPSFSTLYLWKCGNRCSIPFYCMNIFKRRPWFVTVFLSVAQFASLSSVRVNSLPRYYNFVIHDHYNNGRFPRFSQNRNGMLSWPWMASDGSASFSFSFFTSPKRSAPPLFTVPCLIVVPFTTCHFQICQ